MKLRLQTIFRLAGVVVALASLAAAASVKPNPFEGIPKRNVFNLQPPAAIKQNIPEPPPRKPLPKISVTGLVDVRGVPKALLEITEPGGPVRRTILTAGSVFDVLEILDIDIPRERVRVRLDGTEEVLVIEKPKPSVAPPAVVPRPPLPVLAAPPRHVIPVRG